MFKRLPLEFRSLECRNTMYLDLPATVLDNSMWLLSYIKITGGLLLSGKSRYCFSLKCSESTNIDLASSETIWKEYSGRVGVRDSLVTC